MRIDARAVAAGLGACAVVVAAQSLAAGAQFSADMVRTGANGDTTSGKMYVGDGRMRMEMTQQGREVVRITDTNRQMEWILFPAEQSYIERGAPPGSAQQAEPQAAPSAETDPCTGMQGVTCKRVGVEDVNGRPAVKWEMTATQQGQTLTGVEWLDKERGIPLKQTMPNGQGMELKLLGKETLDGRAVEKWEMTNTVPGHDSTRTVQLYDPELKLAIREEFPGGYVSELKNIRIGPQPDNLFVVPAGYSRMTMPEGGKDGKDGKDGKGGPGGGQAPQGSR
jgi:hypothetical protein